MKVLTKLPKTNKTFLFPLSLFIFSLFLISPNLTSAATYYISNSGSDTNDGLTESTPWQTIAKVNGRTFSAGDNILFKRGDTWREQLTVPSSGASGNPITFGAYGSGEKPIIDGADVITGMIEYSTANIWQKTGITIQPNLMYLNDTVGIPKTSIVDCTSVGDWYWDSGTKVFSMYSTSDPSGNVELGQRKNIVFVDDHNYITLKNLTIQHSNDRSKPETGQYDYGNGGVKIDGGSYLTVDGCTIQKNGYFGVRAFGAGSTDLTFTNNIFYRNSESYTNGANLQLSSDSNLIFTNNVSSYSGEDGLRVSGMNNVVIHDNYFNNNAAAGLYLLNMDNASVYDNYFDSNGNAVTATSADGEDYAIGVESCSNVNIYQNTITNQLYNDAIQVFADATGPSHNVNIYRNVISGVTSGDGIGIGVADNLTMENLQIYYNMINNCDNYGIILSHADAGSAVYPINVFNNTITNNIGAAIYLKESTPVILRNNIMANNGQPGVNAYSATIALTTSNNLWYRAAGGNVLRIVGDYYPEEFPVTSFEATAQTTDPLFTNANSKDFTLQSGSPAINAGVDVGLTQDILGNPIVGLPDIGAYEFQTTPTPDITDPTVTAFTIPTTSTTLSVPITTFTATDNIGVTGYLLTETSTEPSPSSGPWSGTSPTTYTFKLEGTKTLYAWARDASGNVSLSSTDQVIITLPVVTPGGGGGGGGGGGSTTPTCLSTETLINNICQPNTTLSLTDKAKLKDVKRDGIINILDFNILMVNWNKNYTTETKEFSLSKGDLNQDGMIGILDVNQLMVYWGVKY